MNCSDKIWNTPIECQPTFARLGEIQVFVNDLPFDKNVRVQYRFPRSKKKRIRQKWINQSKNFRFEVGVAVIKLDDSAMVVTSKAHKLMMKLPNKH